ncbi:MAG: hypothetical protein FJ110_18020 [Deltaproteobacteria bacterium]|nr:hypothetical protein [Deltaproteobacteria bacterium]
MSLKEIFIEPLIPSGLIYLLFLLGGIAVILQYVWIRKRLTRPKAMTLSLLRLFTLVLLTSFLFNPFSLEKKESKVLPSLAILLDTSPSMGLPGRGGKGNRLDEAKALLLEGQNPLLRSLSEKFDVSLYSIGQSLMPLREDELAPLKAGKKKGDPTDAVRILNRKVSLAILLSDGNLKWDERASAGFPMLSIPLGDSKEYKDILVKAVKSPNLAFRGREIGIDVTIKSYGYRGMTLPVVLKDGDRIIAAKEIRIHESPLEIALTLPFASERVGQHNLSLSVPVQTGENITFNNQIDLSIKVARDKIRVLMVSGTPSLNYRFMRMALKNDPSIDLLSFVILRTPSDVLNVPIQEQSLIPFPVDTLFSKELNHFDLLIFDNLPSHLYISPNYYGAIREFVREGGGLAMIGGPHLMDGGRFLRTPLEEVLPVKLIGREGYRRESPQTVRLSRVGKTHPITQLSLDEKENENLWRDMPALDGINLLEPKAFKNVLLEGADGASRPILFADHYGKGRTLILGTDFSWKWYMGMVSRGKSHWAYLRFIERMVRWLTKDVSLNPVQIAFPETPGEAGQELEFRIKMKEENISSHLKGKTLLSIFNSEGAKVESHLKGSESSGEYLGSFIPKREGTYRIKVEFPNGVQEEFVTIGRPIEEREGAPDHERLKAISVSTGGNVLARGDDFLKEINTYGARGEKRFIEEKRSPLWNLPYILLTLLALLSTEWFLRRRWGLI